VGGKASEKLQLKGGKASEKLGLKGSLASENRQYPTSVIGCLIDELGDSDDFENVLFTRE
jgi:hypothetical protein